MTGQVCIAKLQCTRRWGQRSGKWVCVWVLVTSNMFFLVFITGFFLAGSFLQLRELLLPRLHHVPIHGWRSWENIASTQKVYIKHTYSTYIHPIYQYIHNSTQLGWCIPGMYVNATTTIREKRTAFSTGNVKKASKVKLYRDNLSTHLTRKVRL